MRAWLAGRTPIIIGLIAVLIGYLLEAVPALSQRPAAWERLVQWPQLAQLVALVCFTVELISRIRSGR